MTPLKSRTYSLYSLKASSLLGSLIRLQRKKKKFSMKDLSDRAGISRTTLQKIEKGDMKCEIGLVFEVAVLVGVKLFETDHLSIDRLRESIEDKLAVLPQSIHTTQGPVDDKF